MNALLIHLSLCDHKIQKLTFIWKSKFENVYGPRKPVLEFIRVSDLRIEEGFDIRTEERITLLINSPKANKK